MTSASGETSDAPDRGGGDPPARSQSMAVAQAPDGRSALLRLADGAQWRLSAPSGLVIVDSVYFADGFARRRSEQAVVAGVCGAEGATVKWALRRV